jgi:hypothetical protein
VCRVVRMLARPLGPSAFTNILTARLEAIFAIAQRRMFCPSSLHLSALFSFMVPYDAARRGAKQSMMHRVMAGNPAYQSTLKTTLSVWRALLPLRPK